MILTHTVNATAMFERLEAVAINLAMRTSRITFFMHYNVLSLDGNSLQVPLLQRASP